MKIKHRPNQWFQLDLLINVKLKLTCRESCDHGVQEQALRLQSPSPWLQSSSLLHLLQSQPFLPLSVLASIITFTGFVSIIEINQMGNYTSELAWAHKSWSLWIQILVLLTLGKESQMSLKDRANLNPFKRRSLVLFLFLDLEFGKTWRRVMKSPNRMRLRSAHFRAVLAASTSSTTTTILLTSITKPSSLLYSPSQSLQTQIMCEYLWELSLSLVLFKWV